MGMIPTQIREREHLKHVTVTWQKPRRMYTDNFWYDERVHGVGLYYISRKFRGKETPLYIGKTYVSFYNRLIDHHKKWLHKRRGTKYIRLGTITHPENKSGEELRALIKDVEGALIYDMRDVLVQNKMGRKTYEPKHYYVVTNKGYRGELSETVSMRDHIGV
jgi:hypothetical protein